MLRMRETMRWTTLVLPLIALGLSVTGCAAIRAHQAAETEQVLAAAGFQVKPADTPEKLAHLQTLTPRKVVRYVRDGQPQYVYADPETCKCLYVGDEQRYQKFQELSLQKKIADEQLSAAQANWDASMDWGAGARGVGDRKETLRHRCGTASSRLSSRPSWSSWVRRSREDRRHGTGRPRAAAPECGRAPGGRLILPLASAAS